VTKPVLRIVIGSTRPGRVGPAVADWIIERAREHGGFDVQVTDLAELNLPFLDEAAHPRLQKYANPHTLEWSAQVASSDAFVLVIPEYNHSFNAAIKNALDYLNAEWADKAVALASYGGVAAGTRAVQALKPVLVALKMLPVNEGVNIPFVREHIDQDGRFKPTEIEEVSATAMLDELARVTRILRPEKVA
jgi:NAD(P)H-dependent FMN reductase